MLAEGVLVFGGSSRVQGFAKELERGLGLPVTLAEEPLTCVAEGAASPCKAKEETLLHEFEEEIGSGRKLIEDAITTIVSAKTLAEVSTPEGKEKLRSEIVHAIHELIPHPHVKRVLFIDFVTQ